MNVKVIMLEIVKIIKCIRNKFNSKITVQLLAIFAICTLVSFIFYNLSMWFVRRMTYEYDMMSKKMIIDGYNLSLAMQNENFDSVDVERIEFLINSSLKGKPYQAILTDINGNLLYPSGEQTDKLPMVITTPDDHGENTKITMDMGLYSIKVNDTILQLVIVSSDKTNWLARYIKNGMIPGFVGLLSIIIFIFLFLFLTRKKIRYITKIASDIKKISNRDLDYRVEVRGNDELALLARELNFMTYELKEYFEREKNRERSKSEMMVSFSHDLKSPLTAVIGYLSLLKDKGNIGEKNMADYVERAYQKSLRIKGLLQELLDFASLSMEDIKLNKQMISLRHMLEQLISEYTSIFKQNMLLITANLTNENVYANIDSDFMIRVFENLFSNSLRYSPKPGKIRITLESCGGNLLFSITNKCEKIEQEELKWLFEKFYRLEKSRSEETGGTGLGLAIAKRITELHGGRIWAEYMNEEITFFVALPNSQSDPF